MRPPLHWTTSVNGTPGYGRANWTALLQVAWRPLQIPRRPLGIKIAVFWLIQNLLPETEASNFCCKRNGNPISSDILIAIQLYCHKAHLRITSQPGCIVQR